MTIEEKLLQPYKSIQVIDELLQPSWANLFLVLD